MLTQFSLEHFKCFDTKQDFNLSKLNIFAGMNGRGKSSVFQALLMLAQSQLKNNDINILYPNGKYEHLSSFNNLLNNYDADDKDKVMRFYFKSQSEQFKDVKLGYKKSGEWNGELCELEIDGKNYFTRSETIGVDQAEESITTGLQKTYPSFSRILSKFYYVSAHRFGPRLYEEISEEDDCNPQGTMGEKILATIHSHHGTNDILNPDQSKAKSLEKGIEAWLSYILGETKISISASENTLNIKMKNRQSMTQTINAINMGFGYSYILSIILVALIAEQGSTIFIENPEAHLHPKAQAALMHLLSLAAHNSIQVFLETHSEHIVNSARLHALEDDKPISTDDISIHFFDEDFSVKHIKIEPDGQIANWPKGFFDLQEEQLMRILKLGLFKK